MSRSVPWRRSCPDKVSSRIRRASRAQIYLLRATGPTGFLLTAEGDERKFKVFLGDPHSCTCPVFVKERDLCIHILWVLIKKFRVPTENSVIYQLGLVEREIGEVVRGLFTNTGINKATVNNKNCEQTDTREKLSKKEITEEDVCPICQEDLFGKSQPTTYCKYGCGNSVHIKCMKIWAEHQKSSGESTIKCPLCRVDFGTFEVIKTEYLKSATNRQRTDIHLGAVCAQCDVSPISGKCYRCTVCSNYQLCKECFASDPHPQHSFVARQRPNQRWRPASKFQPIPSAVASELQSREITEDDYNILLQLDSSSVSQASVPGHVLNSFPIERVANDNHRLVSGDKKCGVCFCGYRPSQVVRRLPCKHEFHRSCIDSWLSNEHNTCPIDGQVVYSLLTGSRSSRESSTTAASGANLNQQNQRERSLAARKVSLSSMIKRQKKSLAEHDGRLLQNFSLNGLGLGQRNVEPSSEVPRRPTRTNSAPLPPEQTSPQIESSSRHITFDANMMLGRPVVSAERILRYGRHSGDSRLRRCMGLTEQSKNKKMGPKSLSLDNISLSGRKILTSEFSNVCSTSNAVISKRSSQNFANHDASLINTPLVTSSTANSTYQTPVDI